MPDVVNLAHAIGLPPADAIRYFESLGFRPTFDWRESWSAAKERAFSVAGVTKTDVLQDIHGALVKSLNNGGTLNQFIDDLTPTLQKKGWFGRGFQVDKPTGEITGKRINAHRLETIFQTNMQSAYMAGRYAQFIQNADDRPYWQYVAVMDSRTRPAHRALNGRVFRYDDPAWDAFWPPNGYRCRCRVKALSGDDITERGITVSEGEGHLYEVEVPAGRGGTATVTAYKGPGMSKPFAPDPGFSHNPARQWYQPFTPRPLDGAPLVGIPARQAPPLPTATRVDPARLLPDGLTPQDYATRFLGEFGAAIGKPAVFADVTRTPLVISEALFQDAHGVWKIAKGDRHRYLLLLADTIRKPDEIWSYWQPLARDPGKSRLVRRYIRTFEIGDDSQFGLGVFELRDEGWTGATLFVPNPDRSLTARRQYIEAQRSGTLIYRRSGSGD